MARPKPVVLMTRPRPAADQFVAMIPKSLKDRFDFVFSPLIEIAPLAHSKDVDEFSGVIFTSANAVSAFSSRDSAPDVPAYCVGEKTTSSAGQAGWSAQFKGQNADELVETLINERINGPLLHVRGQFSRGEIAERLTRAGIPVAERIVYDQRLVPLSAEARDAVALAPVCIAPIFSPRTARQFANEVTNTGKIVVVALSDAVAEPLRTCGFRAIYVADQPDAESLAQTFQFCAELLTRVEGRSDAQ